MIALPTTQKLQKRRNSKREQKLQKKPKFLKSKGNKRAAATKQQQLETNQIFERAKAKRWPKLQRSKGNNRAEATKEQMLKRAKAPKEQRQQMARS